MAVLYESFWPSDTPSFRITKRRLGTQVVALRQQLVAISGTGIHGEGWQESGCMLRSEFSRKNKVHGMLFRG